MRTMLSFMLAAAAFALPLLAAVPAKAQSCQQLWVQRNSIYKNAGYCFKSRRAIRYFGNGGCSYDSEAAVPLSGSQRARINRIRRLEAEYGCR